MLKKLILLFVVAALAFTGSFLIARQARARQAAKAADVSETGGAAAAAPVGLPRSVRDEQIDSLARSLREQLGRVHDAEDELEKKREMIESIRQQIVRDTDELEKLHTRVVKAVTELNEKRAEFDEQVLLVTRLEEERLGQVAAIYDKMAPERASVVLESMYAGKQREEAIKILFFMNERSAAKALGQIQDPKVAAAMVQEFKRVREGE